MNQQCFLECGTKVVEPAWESCQSLWSDLFLSPSRSRYLQFHPCFVDRGPEPCGACHGAAGSWPRWESSAGRSCTPQSGPSSAPPCGSEGVRPGRRSFHILDSSDVSSVCVSVG